jgi:hypothetical protein
MFGKSRALSTKAARAASAERWPVVCFMHGASELETNRADSPRRISMKRNATLAAAVVVVLGLSGASAWAQATESFLGTVKAVNGSSVTVERGTITGIFAFDSKTHVGVAGATAKTKENQAAGKAGLTVPDVVHIGDQVMVKYVEKANSMIASDIQVRVSLASRK